MMDFKLFVGVFVGFLFCFASSVLAQGEESADAVDVVSESKPASEARQTYEATFAEWKSMLTGMRMVQAKAENAEDDELAALQVEYDDFVAKGEAMIPKLRDAAIGVYQEAPNEDNQVARWLSTIGNDFVDNDQFDAAKPALDALVEGETTDPTVYNSAAIVAFVKNDFESAKTLFEKTAANGSFTTFSRGLAIELGNYEKFWEREEKLHEQAAKAEGQDRLPQVEIKTTQGSIIAELFENEAPETVGNFIHLIEKGFYDGRTFHRVIGNFMVQGGCPKGDGTGGPGYSIFCECVRPDNRKHFAGSLSMAHSGRDTGGSQFFMTHVPVPHLNEKHTVFGRIIEGFDVLAKIKRRDPDDPADLAKTPDKIIEIVVLSKRDHEYKPNKK